MGTDQNNDIRAPHMLFVSNQFSGRGDELRNTTQFQAYKPPPDTLTSDVQGSPIEQPREITHNTARQRHSKVRYDILACQESCALSKTHSGRNGI